MARPNMQNARSFVERLSLPPAPAGFESLVPSPGAVGSFDFDAAKAQAAIVGADIIVFAKGVTEQRRKDIVNAALLAQLAATAKVGKGARPLDWYEAYFDVLQNIGWVVQARQFARHAQTADTFSAQEAVLSIAAKLFGAPSTALDLIRATIDGLNAVKDQGPWFTLFTRETQSAETSRFQVSLADENEAGQFRINLMSFALTAQATMTQVAFFKFVSRAITLEHASGAVTINDDVMAAVRNDIASRLVGHAMHYIKALPPLPSLPAP